MVNAVSLSSFPTDTPAESNSMTRTLHLVFVAATVGTVQRYEPGFPVSVVITFQVVPPSSVRRSFTFATGLTVACVVHATDAGSPEAKSAPSSGVSSLTTSIANGASDASAPSFAPEAVRAVTRTFDFGLLAGWAGTVHSYDLPVTPVASGFQVAPLSTE